MAGEATYRRTVDTGNVWLKGLLWGSEWSSRSRSTVVDVYIAGSHGDEAVDTGLGSTVTAYQPFAQEAAAIRSAMASFEAVCGLDFRSTRSQAGADIVWSIVSSLDSPGAYGWSTPPGYAKVGGEARSLVAINYETYLPVAGPQSLVRGGFDFCTFIHELGHAVGLAHPHDHGGRSASFPGVQGPMGDLGAYGMNQGVFTMMSYNDGWRTGPEGHSPARVYGYQAGPMALDIAALQHMYGVNRSYRTADDAYRLPEANKVGTFYSCIWDAGGIDTILGAAKLPNHIDLRAATLRPEIGGGGFLSYASGIHGGFTIAQGVRIENARGGARADDIGGNAAANRLLGLAGHDFLHGGGGNDALFGGLDHDTLEGGAGNDRLFGEAGADRLFGGVGSDWLSGGAGDDRLFGNAHGDLLHGGGGRDTLLGGAGSDRLIGAAGADLLIGGAGADSFIFLSASDNGPGGLADQILDFRPGDRIDLSRIDADLTTPGDQAFHLGDSMDVAAGRIQQVWTERGILLKINLDADPEAEMAVLLRGISLPLTESSFNL